MKIFPAIDLRSGQVVRLTKGDYAQMSTYDADPAFVAESFINQGAKHLHVVDLDGAKDGTQRNLRVIERILRRGGLFVEVGGGARDEASVRRYLDIGVNRVILGTMAVEQPALMERLAANHPGQIAAGVDAKGGKVAIRGWQVVTAHDAYQFMAALPGRGVRTAIYTDIAKDGMLQGPNLCAYRELQAIEGLDIIASGGVTTIEDIGALRDLGVRGAIVGKAIYEGKIDLVAALAAGGEQ